MSAKTPEQVAAEDAAKQVLIEAQKTLAAEKEATRVAREKKAVEAKAAHESKQAELTAKKAEREAAAKAKADAKVVRLVAHGITRPAAGTGTARIWEIADELSAAAKAPACRADVLKVAGAESINLATCATQYGRWRVFNGLRGQDSQGRPAATQEATAPSADSAAEAVAPVVEGGPTVEVDPGVSA